MTYLGAAGLIGTVAWLAWGRQTPAEVLDIGRVLPGLPVLDKAVDAAAGHGDTTDLAQIEHVTASRRLDDSAAVLGGVRGFALDLFTNQPIAALVRLGESVTNTDARTGAFESRAPDESVDRVQIEAPGYHTEIVLLKTRTDSSVRGPWDMGVIRMAPQEAVRLVVHDEHGVPCAGADVVMVDAAVHAAVPASIGAPRHLGVTDEFGVLWVHSLANQTLFASRADLASGLVRVGAGTSGRGLQLTLARSFRLGIRAEHTGEPLADVELYVRETSSEGGRAFVLRTESTGLTPSPLPRGHFVLESPGARLSRGSGSAEPELLVHDIAQTGVLIDTNAEVTSELWLERASGSGRKLLLVSGRSQQPIVTARLRLERFWEGMAPALEARWLPASEAFDSKVPDGIHSLDALSIDMHEAESPLRLTIEAQGFEVQSIDDVLAAIPSGSTLEISLVDAQQVDLRFFGSDRVPFTRDVWIRDGISRELRRFDLSQVGMMAGFTLRSASLDVCGSPLAADLIRQVDVSGAFGRGPQVLDIVVPTGRIEVLLGSLPPTSIGCVRRGGTRLEATRREEGRLVYDHVPIGQYAVGALEVISLESVKAARGIEAYTTIVTEGRTVRLDLSGTPAAVGAIEGFVRCIGIEPGLLEVVAYFGSEGDPIPGNLQGPRFKVRDDGAFALTGLATMPSRLVFGTSDVKGAFGVLALGAVGADNVVECGRLAVEPPAAGCEGGLTVLFSMDQVAKNVIGMRAVDGPCTEPLVIEHVPCSVRRIQVFSSRGRRALDVSISAGRTTDVRLE